MRYLFLALVLNFPTPLLRADQWSPFGGKSSASESGKYFVEIASDETFIYGKKTSASTRTILARGSVEQPPLHVLVPSNGLGFIIIERYYTVGYGYSVLWYDPKGAVRVRLRLDDLKFKTEFMKSVSSIHWLDGYWLNEAKNQLVLVAQGDLLRTIDYGKGTVATPDERILYEALSHGGVLGRRKALEIIHKKSLKGAPRPLLEQILNGEETPVDVRLRAAAVLIRMGYPSGKKLMSRLLSEGNKSAETYELAVSLVPDFFEPAKAAGILLRPIHSEDGGVAWAAMQAFVQVGEPAVSTLVRILKEKPTEQNETARGWSALALDCIGCKDALPHLIAATRDPSNYVAEYAIKAVISLAEHHQIDVSRELADALAAGTKRDDLIAAYFQAAKTPVLPILIKTLCEHAPYSLQYGDLLTAIASQSGVHYRLTEEENSKSPYPNYESSHGMNPYLIEWYDHLRRAAVEAGPAAAGAGIDSEISVEISSDTGAEKARELVRADPRLSSCTPLLIDTLLHTDARVRDRARKRLETLAGRRFTRESELHKKYPQIKEAMALLERGMEKKEEALLQDALARFKSLSDSDAADIERMTHFSEDESYQATIQDIVFRLELEPGEYRDKELDTYSRWLSEKFALEYKEWLYWFDKKARK